MKKDGVNYGGVLGGKLVPEVVDHDQTTSGLLEGHVVAIDREPPVVKPVRAAAVGNSINYVAHDGLRATGNVHNSEDSRAERSCEGCVIEVEVEVEVWSGGGWETDDRNRRIRGDGMVLSSGRHRMSDSSEYGDTRILEHDGLTLRRPVLTFIRVTRFG